MRLIDADALDLGFPMTDDLNGMLKQIGVEMAKTRVTNAPTIDAVPVVRCKDCKHGRKIDKTKSPERYYRDDCIVCRCENVVGDEPMVYIPTHFCSYGERRSDD